MKVAHIRFYDANVKIAQIKFLRAIAGMGLKEAKDAVETSLYRKQEIKILTPFSLYTLNQIGQECHLGMHTMTIRISMDEYGSLNKRPVRRTIQINFNGSASYYRKACFNFLVSISSPNWNIQEINLMNPVKVQTDCDDENLNNAINNAGLRLQDVNIVHQGFWEIEGVINPLVKVPVAVINEALKDSFDVFVDIKVSGKNIILTDTVRLSEFKAVAERFTKLLKADK